MILSSFSLYNESIKILILNKLYFLLLSFLKDRILIIFLLLKKITSAFLNLTFSLY